jgi:ECF sigma factor
LETRDDLWQLLVMLVERKATDKMLQKLTMRKFEGYTNQEIVQEWEISAQAVERKLKPVHCKWEGHSI